jgi:hypothetical protein
MFRPATQPAHAPDPKREPHSTSVRSRRNFVSISMVFRPLFRNLGRRLRYLSLQHHHRPRRWRQILNLDMDREAFASDLSDHRRAPGLFWRFRKRQHVVPAVLHDNSDASPYRAKASLRICAHSRLALAASPSKSGVRKPERRNVICSTVIGHDLESIAFVGPQTNAFRRS